MTVDAESAGSASAPGSSRWTVIVPIICALWYLAQCAWFIQTQSLIYDEPAHVMTGLDAWREQRFDRWNDQPPLGRLLLTLPLLRGEWHVEKLSTISPSPEALAWHTRPVNVVLGIALGFLVWSTTRRLFGSTAACVAAGLFACSPPMIAHFSVATVDGLMTLTVLAAAVSLAAWWREPSWTQTWRLAAALGLMLVAKFSAPALFAASIVLMALRPGARAHWLPRLLQVASVITIGFTTIWSAYFFTTQRITFRNGAIDGPYGAPQTVVVPVALPISTTVTMPAGQYWSALSGVLQHSRKGQPSFFLGEVSRSGGWRAYFPVAIALKWPAFVWLPALVAIAVAACRRWQVPHEAGLLLVLPALLFAFAVFSNLNIGDRYVLPIFPFLLIWAAGAWTALAHRFGRPFAPSCDLGVPGASCVLLIGLVALQAADSLRYAPDYLSYFAPVVSPNRSWRLLTDSNLDWGQGLLALRRYEREHPNESISLAYFGGVDPRQYRIRSRILREGERPTGTVVVSATHLSGQYLNDPNAYRWVLSYPEIGVLNHTLHVFAVAPNATPQP